jgi:hypothetical protein
MVDIDLETKDYNFLLQILNRIGRNEKPINNVFEKLCLDNIIFELTDHAIFFTKTGNQVSEIHDNIELIFRLKERNIRFNNKLQITKSKEEIEDFLYSITTF